MSSKFKYGDKVIVNSTHGKISSVRKENNVYVCTVKFDSANLVPPEMDYEERHIKFRVSIEDACPFCQTKWVVVKYNNNVWKDCKPCNGKSEDLIDQFKTIQARAEKERKEKIDKQGKSDFEKSLDYTDDDFGFLLGI